MNKFNKPILYLDYDGVLHPDEIYRRKDGTIFVRNAPGEHAELFMHASLLEALVSKYDIQIILATSWVKAIGFDKAKSHLPKSVSDKIVGSTYHSSMREIWPWLSRYQQIIKHVERHSIEGWLALDNDNEGWDIKHIDNLALCDHVKALPSATHTLVQWLDRALPMEMADTLNIHQSLG